MKALHMTREQAEAHQRKHGFLKPRPLEGDNPQSNAATSARGFNSHRGCMNKTEAEYAMILEAMKRRGEILRYDYEGITLQWADMRYTPDFIVLNLSIKPWCIQFIEVKGPKIWDRDIVRFKGARAYWSEFEFEMHQRDKNGQWSRIH